MGRSLPALILFHLDGRQKSRRGRKLSLFQHYFTIWILRVSQMFLATYLIIVTRTALQSLTFILKMALWCRNVLLSPLRQLRLESKQSIYLAAGLGSVGFRYLNFAHLKTLPRCHATPQAAYFVTWTPLGFLVLDMPRTTSVSVVWDLPKSESRN